MLCTMVLILGGYLGRVGERTHLRQHEGAESHVEGGLLCAVRRSGGEGICHHDAEGAHGLGNLTEITADEAKRAHLIFGRSEIDVGIFHPTIVAREGPVEIYSLVSGTGFTVYAKTFVVCSDGVVEIYRNSEIFVEQIALMLHRVVGLVGDDKVVP